VDIGEQIKAQERICYWYVGRSNAATMDPMAEAILKSLRLVPKLLAIKGEVEAMLPWMALLRDLDVRVGEVIPLKADYFFKRLKAALAALDAGEDV